MISIDARRFIDACEAFAAALPDVADAAADRVGTMMQVSIARSPKWTDRTFQLRSSFQTSFRSSGDGAQAKVDVDPSVAGRRRTRRGEVASKTPPSVYARFLNYGTTRIEPREFMADAWALAVTEGRFVVFDEFQRTLSRGS